MMKLIKKYILKDIDLYDYRPLSLVPIEIRKWFTALTFILVGLIGIISQVVFGCGINVGS